MDEEFVRRFLEVKELVTEELSRYCTSTGNSLNEEPGIRRAAEIAGEIMAKTAHSARRGVNIDICWRQIIFEVISGYVRKALNTHHILGHHSQAFELESAARIAAYMCTSTRVLEHIKAEFRLYIDMMRRRGINPYF